MNISAKRSMKVICFSIKKIYLKRQELQRSNDVNFRYCCGFSISVIWSESFMLLFDSHGQNASGLHDPDGKVAFEVF